MGLFEDPDLLAASRPVLPWERGQKLQKGGRNVEEVTAVTFQIVLLWAFFFFHGCNGDLKAWRYVWLRRLFCGRDNGDCRVEGETGRRGEGFPCRFYRFHFFF